MIKKITLVAALFATVAMNAQIWEEGFEGGDYNDFDINPIGSWTQHDLDGDTTYGSQAYDFENEAYVGTAIVFNPSMCTPDASTEPDWQVRTGDRGLWMIAGSGDVSGTPVNNDYIITPQIDLSGATGSYFTFFAKSITDQYGLERFNVLISTTGTEVADFTDVGGEEFQAPVGAYQAYNIDISAYDGEQVYLAIHYVAQDSFILQMDDFSVQEGALGITDTTFDGFAHAVNNNQLVLKAANQLQEVALYDVLGQQVVSQKLNATQEQVDIAALTQGVYIVRVMVEGKAKSFKIVKQ